MWTPRRARSAACSKEAASSRRRLPEESTTRGHPSRRERWDDGMTDGGLYTFNTGVRGDVGHRHDGDKVGFTCGMHACAFFFFGVVCVCRCCFGFLCFVLGRLVL